MNILFITLLDIRSINEHNIYADLMREFAKNQHKIYIISPIERRFNFPLQLIEDEKYPNVHILKIRVGNIQKTNTIEKGISTLAIEHQLYRGIKKHLKNIDFDLILYTTPPITLIKPIKYIKKRNNAKTYLLLKDIFPQNAVDLGMVSKTGAKKLLYRYFRGKEIRLYELSDRIGCMSQANCDYIIKHNSQLDAAKLDICPNCIEVQDMTVSYNERLLLREKYDIPKDKTVFVYGGNFGKPQGIPFIIDCLRTQENNENAFFLIVGDGTEFSKIEEYFDKAKPNNMKLMKWMPKNDYDKMLAACDVGMIFLDHRFTIPNFPSRLLSYMQAGLPVLACTDTNTDVGRIIVDGRFGWWCESDNTEGFARAVAVALNTDLEPMKQNSIDYLFNNYTVKQGYRTIVG